MSSMGSLPAPENPVMRNVTSFVDQSYTPSRAAISVFWKVSCALVHRLIDFID